MSRKGHIFTRVLPFCAALMFALSYCALLAAEAGAYTLEKRDEPVTEKMVISPIKVELTLSPGQSATRDVTVVNRTGRTIAVDFLTEDFQGSDDPSVSHEFLGEDDSTWGAHNWIKPELEGIVLEHGETIVFEAKVSVPVNAEPGGHYAALFAATEDIVTSEEQPGGVKVTSRVGTLFLITVPGDINSSGELDEPEAPRLASTGPLDIGLIFRNMGNVHETPSGTIKITNIIGQTVAELPVSAWVVLPDSARRTMVAWPDKWHFLRYKIEAEISYGEDGKVLYASSTVWFFPWKIMLALLAAAIVIGFIAMMVVRRRRRLRQEIQDEIEELRSLQEGAKSTAEEEIDAAEPAAPATAPEAAAPAADAGGPEEAPEPAKPQQQNIVPLNELFPSMEDTSLVDLSDKDTRQLVRSLISNEMDLARSFMVEGQVEDARRELLEARSAALKMQLLSEVAMIDDLLQYL